MPPKPKAAAKAPSASSYQARPATQRAPATSIPPFTPPTFQKPARVPEIGPIFTQEVVNSTDFLPSESFVDTSCQGLRLWPDATRWRRLGSDETSEIYPPPPKAAAGPAAGPVAKAKAAPPASVAPVAERLAEFQKQKTMYSSDKFPIDGKQAVWVQWFYSALAAIQLHKEFLSCPLPSLIHPQTVEKFPLFNPKGKYVVRLCVRGRWTAVTVDDFVPEVLCMQFVDLWPTILAKALLKAYANDISRIPVVAALTGWIRQDAEIVDLKKFPIAMVSLVTELAPVVEVPRRVDISDSEDSDSDETAVVALSPRVAGHCLIFSVVQREEATQVRGLVDGRLQPVGGEKTRDEWTNGGSEAEEEGGGWASEEVRRFRTSLMQEAEGSFWVDSGICSVWRPEEREKFVVDAAEFPMYVEVEKEVIGSFYGEGQVRLEKLAELLEFPRNFQAVFDRYLDLGGEPEVVAAGVYRVTGRCEGVLELAGAVRRVEDELELARRNFGSVVTVETAISVASPGYGVVVKKFFEGEGNSFRVFGNVAGNFLKISVYQVVSDFVCESVFVDQPLALAAEFPCPAQTRLLLVLHGDLPTVEKFPITLHFVGLREVEEATQVQPALSYFADIGNFRERLTVASEAASAALRVSVGNLETNFQVRLLMQKSPTETASDATDPGAFKRLANLQTNLTVLAETAGVGNILLPHLRLKPGVVYVVEATSEGNFSWQAEIFGAVVELGADRMQADIEKLLVATWQGNSVKFPTGVSELWSRFYAEKEAESAAKVAAIRAKKPTGKNKEAELAAQDKEIANLVFKAPLKAPADFALADFPNPTARLFVAELLNLPVSGVAGTPDMITESEISPLAFPVKALEAERAEDATTRSELHAVGRRRWEILENFRVKHLAQGPGGLDGFVLDEAVRLVEEAAALEVGRVDKANLTDLVSKRISLVQKFDALMLATSAAAVEDAAEEDLNLWRATTAEISDLAATLKAKNVPVAEELLTKLNSLAALISSSGLMCLC